MASVAVVVPAAAAAAAKTSSLADYGPLVPVVVVSAARVVTAA